MRELKVTLELGELVIHRHLDNCRQVSARHLVAQLGAQPAEFVGQLAPVTVTSVLQTRAGKMIFADLKSASDGTMVYPGAPK